jgi:hypothetical protein
LILRAGFINLRRLRIDFLSSEVLMKKICISSLGILVVLAVLTIAGALSAQDKTVRSVWAAQPPKIDGASKDWEGVALTDAEKGGVQYALRNDANSLYVLFVITDQKVRSTIEELGLTLYVDPAGAASKDYGILFRRKRITANESIALLEKQGPVSDEQKDKMRATPFYNYYFTEVVDKKGDTVPVPAGVGGPPAMFKFAADKKNLVFELMIPLRRLAPALPGIGAGVGDQTSLGFEWGGPTEAQRKAIARARGDAAKITNETSLSGMGTDPNASSSKVDRMPPKFLFWTKVQLVEGS